MANRQKAIDINNEMHMLLTVETHVESVSVDFYQKERRK